MPDRQRSSRVVRTSLLTAAFACITGCQQQLFSRKEPRTQYEQYDRMRQRNAPMEEPDVFGNPQPALRQRLSQR